MCMSSYGCTYVHIFADTSAYCFMHVPTLLSKEVINLKETF